MMLVKKQELVNTATWQAAWKKLESFFNAYSFKFQESTNGWFNKKSWGISRWVRVSISLLNNTIENNIWWFLELLIASQSATITMYIEFLREVELHSLTSESFIPILSNLQNIIRTDIGGSK